MGLIRQAHGVAGVDNCEPKLNHKGKWTGFKMRGLFFALEGGIL